MKNLLVCSLITTILLCGCNSAKQLPREIVIVPDISQSIDARAEQQMFAAIEDVAQHLHRGDTLTIIPVTGDAESELQGRILYYAVPRAENRQAYDGDILKLDLQIKDDLTRLQAEAIAHPGKHTDILGSVRVAMKEFSSGVAEKRLAVLSDFIQDDGRFNFKNDPRLLNNQSAGSIANGAKKQMPPHASIKIFLGRLRSSDFSSLSSARQGAIDDIWSQIMLPAKIRADGTGGLTTFLHD